MSVTDNPPEHNHVTRDIKPKGECVACDLYWENSTVTVPRTPECFMCGVRGSEPMDAIRRHASGRVQFKYRCTDRQGCGTRSHEALRKALILGPGKP